MYYIFYLNHNKLEGLQLVGIRKLNIDFIKAQNQYDQIVKGLSWGKQLLKKERYRAVFSDGTEVRLVQEGSEAVRGYACANAEIFSEYIHIVTGRPKMEEKTFLLVLYIKEKYKHAIMQVYNGSWFHEDHGFEKHTIKQLAELQVGESYTLQGTNDEGQDTIASVVRVS